MGQRKRLATGLGPPAFAWDQVISMWSTGQTGKPMASHFAVTLTVYPHLPQLHLTSRDPEPTPRDLPPLVPTPAPQGLLLGVMPSLLATWIGVPSVGRGIAVNMPLSLGSKPDRLEVSLLATAFAARSPSSKQHSLNTLSCPCV